MKGKNGSGGTSRYSHLLEPIRDLAQNWEIDVATELEEYLQEVRALCSIVRSENLLQARGEGGIVR